MKQSLLLLLFISQTVLGIAQNECSVALKNLDTYLDTVTVFDDCFKLAGKKYIKSKQYRKDRKGYDIRKEYENLYPDLIYLILHSRSIETKEEKQNWFNLLPLMNTTQIDRLYEILQKEKRKLRGIEVKYEDRKAEIKQRYLEKWLSSGEGNNEVCDLSSGLQELDFLRKNESEEVLKIEEYEFKMWSECGENYQSIAESTENLDHYEKAFYYYYAAITQTRVMFHPDTKVDELFNNMLVIFYKIRRQKPNQNEEDCKFMLRYAVDLTDIYSSHQSTLTKYIPKVSRIYGNMSWYYLFTKDYNSVLESGQIGFDMDNTNHWIKTNIGHALLLTGKYDEAIAIYDSVKEIVDVAGGSNKTLREALLADFDVLEKNGLTHKTMAKARRHLK